MANFISLLEKLHYLNHPFLSGLSSLSLILIGIFVLVKNPKSPLYVVFFGLTFTVCLWFSGNVLSMLYFKNTVLSLFWFRVGYSAVPFISVTYYHFYVLQCNKSKRGLKLLYALCIPELIYLWLPGQVNTGAHFLLNVGIYWDLFSPFTYFGAYGMIKYSIISWFVVFSFLGECRKETIPLKKNQLKYFTIGFTVTAMGAVEWLVSFGIPLHFAWIVIPPFIGIIGYAIVRYKAMEIDTVIHRTILWIITVFLLIVPAVIINLALYKAVPAGNIALNFITISAYLIFFVTYYNRLRPRIDHLFRRRKYDYQAILGKIAALIASTINIGDLTKELLTGVCEIMYLRSSILYVLSKDATLYYPTGKWGYKEETEGAKPQAKMQIYTSRQKTDSQTSLILLSCESSLGKWINEYRDAIEREQVEIDPRFEKIKQEALAWFKDNSTEVIVPLVFENKVIAVLCLGKKENLQAYTDTDLRLLKKLGKDVGVTVFNALHYEDLAEKERMDEEIKMAGEIQMSLLPKDLPQLPGLSISGLMLPAKGIGGDYYDFITLPKQDELAIVIGDVSGKGVAAALVMAMAKTAIHTLSQEETSPKQILLRTNQFLNQSAGGHKGMTLLYLLWQAKTKTITYSSAGHEHILIYRASSGNVEVIMSGGIMLGMPVNIDDLLEEKQFNLSAADKILLYTDGVTEAANEQGERFGFERLKGSFKKHSQSKASELIQAIKEEVYSFIGSYAQYDDITLVLMEEKV